MINKLLCVVALFQVVVLSSCSTSAPILGTKEELDVVRQFRTSPERAIKQYLTPPDMYKCDSQTGEPFGTEDNLILSLKPNMTFFVKSAISTKEEVAINIYWLNEQGEPLYSHNNYQGLANIKTPNHPEIGFTTKEGKTDLLIVGIHKRTPPSTNSCWHRSAWKWIAPTTNHHYATIGFESKSPGNGATNFLESVLSIRSDPAIEDAKLTFNPPNNGTNHVYP